VLASGGPLALRGPGVSADDARWILDELM